MNNVFDCEVCKRCGAKVEGYAHLLRLHVTYLGVCEYQKQGIPASIEKLAEYVSTTGSKLTLEDAHLQLAYFFTDFPPEKQMVRLV